MEEEEKFNKLVKGYRFVHYNLRYEFWYLKVNNGACKFTIYLVKLFGGKFRLSVSDEMSNYRSSVSLIETSSIEEIDQLVKKLKGSL